jgi:hypothetical protein
MGTERQKSGGEVYNYAIVAIYVYLFPKGYITFIGME